MPLSLQSIRKIAISTGGGDAPGLNAVIRAIVLAAAQRGWECFGIRDGYNGLLIPEDYPDGGLVPLTRKSVAGITHLGRHDPRHHQPRQPDQVPGAAGRRHVRRDRPHATNWSSASTRPELDALITIGGDGSLAIGYHLASKGLRVIGVPKTIDNDLDQHVHDVRLRHRGVVRHRVPRPPAHHGDLRTGASWWSRSWAATPAGSRCTRASPATPT